MRINPRDMERMMKQLGIKNEEIGGVEEVIIKTNTKIIKILPASVQKVMVQGQTTIQVVVSSMEEVDKEQEDEEEQGEGEKYNEEDIKIVMEKKGVSREKAIEILEKVEGDLVRALME